jgi:hypothetical protein
MVESSAQGKWYYFKLRNCQKSHQRYISGNRAVQDYYQSRFRNEQKYWVICEKWDSVVPQ